MSKVTLQDLVEAAQKVREKYTDEEIRAALNWDAYDTVESVTGCFESNSEDDIEKAVRLVKIGFIQSEPRGPLCE